MNENSFSEIAVRDFTGNAFNMIGRDWMLITAGTAEKVNTMTASWGGMGVIWNMPVTYMFIRESRYTKQFVDDQQSYSLCFFDHDAHRDMLLHMGEVSGRDEDKIAGSGLELLYSDNTPYFAEASTVLICRKLSCHTLSSDGIIDKQILKNCYPDGDFHDMYIGEIVRILKHD